MKPPPVSAADIRQAMLATFSHPQWAILWEVGDATGARHTRFADAVMMSLWPSRGLELHGVEIKVTRYDFRREAKDPRKAETIAAYCDRWWLHAAPGVVEDLAEVPQAWGLRVWSGSGWNTRREAAKTEAEACDRGFLAALLRRADRQDRGRIERQAADLVESDRKAIEAKVAAEVERRSRVHSVLIEEVRKFEEASGLKLNEYYSSSDAAQMGQLVKALRETGLVNGWKSLTGLVKDLRAKALALDMALAESGLPFEVPAPPQGIERGRRAGAVP